MDLSYITLLLLLLFGNVGAAVEKLETEKEAQKPTPAAPPENSSNSTSHRTVVTKQAQEDEEVEPYRVNLVIVIMNENHPAHVKKAQKMIDYTMDQVKGKELQKQLRIITLHPDLYKIGVVHGGWTYLPLAKPLINEFPGANWFYFIHEFAMISVEKLFKILQKYDAPRKAILVGRAVRDVRPVITHHFQWADGLDGSGLEYPEQSAGMLMSRNLLTHLIDNGDYTIHLPNPNNVDIFYEIAKLVREKFSYRVLLKHEPMLCGANWRQFSDPAKAAECVSETNWDEWMDTKEFPVNETCYAVKTHQYNHHSRLKVLRSTWAKSKALRNQIKFYSEVADPEVGTVQVPPNIPNVERGHCEKTMYILRDFNENDSKRCKWLVLADDDTLINTARMARVLHRYSELTMVKEGGGIDPKTGKPLSAPQFDLPALAVGERYGFNHWPVVENNPTKAYDFLTGGAGIAFTRTAVAKILESHCMCGLRDPDDMMLGLCMNRNNIPLIHNPLFHQAPPTSYPWEMIRYQRPVSFHSFQDIDGKVAYDHFLAPEVPKKYDGSVGAIPQAFHEQFPSTTPSPGLFKPPKVDPYGNVVEEQQQQRQQDFGQPIRHEEL